MLHRVYYYCPVCRGVISFPEEGGKTVCGECGTHFRMMCKDPELGELRIDYYTVPEALERYRRKQAAITYWEEFRKIHFAREINL